MAIESSQQKAVASNSEQGTSVPDCSPENRFAVVARALWPRKTAFHLAYKANVSERAAKFWLSGDREPSLDACLVILDEIRPRRSRD